MECLDLLSVYLILRLSSSFNFEFLVFVQLAKHGPNESNVLYSSNRKLVKVASTNAYNFDKRKL